MTKYCSADQIKEDGARIGNIRHAYKVLMGNPKILLERARRR
jgi:hypothetical protein